MHPVANQSGCHDFFVKLGIFGEGATDSQSASFGSEDIKFFDIFQKEGAKLF